MTRRLLLLLCLCPLLIAAASAYIVTIDAPRTLTAGEPLVVNGTSTLPAGYTHDLVLYRGSVERGRATIVVQPGGNFSARFETAGFRTGDYRIELVQPANPGFFGTDSVTNRLVTIVDRSKEVVVTSPTAQSDVSNLTVAGTAPGKQSASIGIAVSGAGNFSYGPEYVLTDANGAFSRSVPIPGPGEYRVTLQDPAGVIVQYTVTVTGEPRSDTSATVPSIPATFTIPESGLATATPLSTMTATIPTRAGLSPFPVLGAGLLLLLFARRR